MKNTDIRICLLGDNSVGKSNLSNVFAGETFIEHLKIIGDNINIVKTNIGNNKKINILLYDPEPNFNLLNYTQFLGFIIIYSITNRNSFLKCEYWLNEIKKSNYLHLHNNILLLGNKCDNEENREVLYKEGKEFAEKNQMIFFECSAKNNINVKDPINSLIYLTIKMNGLLNIVHLNKSTNPILISILGNKSTGKTFITNKVPNNIIIKMNKLLLSVHIKLIEIPSEINDKNISKELKIINESKGIFLLFSFNDKNSFDLKKWIEKIVEIPNNFFFPVIIIGNLINSEKKREISYKEGLILSYKYLWNYYEISNLNNLILPINDLLNQIILYKNESLNPIQYNIENKNNIIRISFPKKIDKIYCEEFFGREETKEGEYTGYFLKGEKNGKGYFKYLNDNKYYGQWRNNERNGFGKLQYSNGESFIGFFKDNNLNNGKFIYKDNSIYEGNFKDNLRNGFGKLIYSNGDIYEGNWLNNIKEGQGKYIYKNSKTIKRDINVYKSINSFLNEIPIREFIYEGEWKNNLWNGNGIYITDKGKYEGIFENGFLKGKGKIIYSNGDIYDGNIKDFLKEGYGEYFYNNKDIYYGHFNNDLKNGKGKMKYSNGNLFIGKWKDDKKINGILFTDIKDYYEENNIERIILDFKGGKLNLKGKIYCGDYIEDKLFGKGYLLNSNYCYIGDFIDNKRNGRGIIFNLNGEKFDSFWENDIILNNVNIQIKENSLKKSSIRKCEIR